MIFVRSKGVAFRRRDGDGRGAPMRTIRATPVCLLNFPLERAVRRRDMVLVDPSTLPEGEVEALIREAEEAAAAQAHALEAAAIAPAPAVEVEGDEKKEEGEEGSSDSSPTDTEIASGSTTTTTRTPSARTKRAGSERKPRKKG